MSLSPPSPELPAAGSVPPPPVDSSGPPRLPPSGLPTLPTAPSPMPAPALPGAAPAIAAPASADVVPTMEPVPEIVQSQPYFDQTPASPVVDPALLVDPTTVDPTQGDAPSGEVAVPEPPRALLPSKWLRRIVIWANVLSLPGYFVGDYVGLGLTAACIVALIVWSAVVTANARRARPATTHHRAPHPFNAAMSWFVAPALAIPVAVALLWTKAWVDEAGYDQEGDRSMVMVGVIVLVVVVMFIAIYRPYGVLARAARWVSADSSKFRIWFAAPFIAGVLAVGLQIMSGLYLLADSSDGEAGGGSIGAVALIIVSVTFPWLAWVVFGHRAMRTLEQGVRHQHQRAIRESMGAEGMNPLIAHYMQGASEPLAAPEAPPLSSPIA